MTLNAQIAVRIYNITVVTALQGGSIDKTLTLPLKRLTSHPYLSIYNISRAAVVHLNFRAGSTFPVPACTVSPGHCVNKADT